MLTQNEQDAIEALIDSNSLNALSTAIAEICFGKAQHLEDNWQDDETAEDWNDAGDVFENATMEVSPL